MKTSVAVLLLVLCHLGTSEAFFVHHIRRVLHGIHGNAKVLFNLKKLEARLQNTERQLIHLRKEVQGTRVAFGASLGKVGNIGPFRIDVTLAYRVVYFNSGSYNPRTGIFTAPVHGVYYFSFTGHNSVSKQMGLRLVKNGVQVVTVFNRPGYRGHETSTNGMILRLRAGDKVFMRLMAKTRVYDNQYDHSTFTGHLLYRL